MSIFLDAAQAFVILTEMSFSHTLIFLCSYLRRKIEIVISFFQYFLIQYFQSIRVVDIGHICLVFIYVKLNLLSSNLTNVVAAQLHLAYLILRLRQYHRFQQGTLSLAEFSWVFMMWYDEGSGLQDYILLSGLTNTWPFLFVEAWWKLLTEAPSRPILEFISRHQ